MATLYEMLIVPKRIGMKIASVLALAMNLAVLVALYLAGRGIHVVNGMTIQRNFFEERFEGQHPFTWQKLSEADEFTRYMMIAFFMLCWLIWPLAYLVYQSWNRAPEK